jgi:pimeloyl-ACP methyl ester carboxylesterase
MKTRQSGHRPHAGRKVSRRTRTLRAAAVLLAFLLLAGCSSAGNYLGFWKKERERRTEFKQEPTAKLEREIHPEDSFLLSGPVTLKGSYDGPLLVVAVTDKFKSREIAAERVMHPPLFYYQAYLPEGDYDLYFFADLDRDGWFNQTEMIAGTKGAPVKIRKEKVADGLTFAGPSFALDIKDRSETDLPVKVRSVRQDYVIKSLDDGFFDPEWGEIGMFDANAFFAHTQRFIFSLEPYDPARTAVFFVHGVAGTPRDFKYLVEGLDRSRYQPWFIFYPSGGPLQKLGSFFAEVLRVFDQDFRSRRAIVVAHSMGGLVALSGLNEYVRGGAGEYVKGYISFDSPYGGVESARKAVDGAPAVLSCWRDVATGSAFLEKLYSGSAARSIPFHMFFGYETGRSSDGTITLQSQLEHRVQFAAEKVYGFNADHVGILNNDPARRKFLEVLDHLDAARVAANK